MTEYRHGSECNLCEVIKGVIVRLERIERADHSQMADPLADARNAIASMQAEAQVSRVELLPLIQNMRPHRTLGDVPIGRSRWRDQDRGNWD